MGLVVVEGKSRLRVRRGHEIAFAEALSRSGIGGLCAPRWGPDGRIVGVVWHDSACAALPAFEELEALHPHLLTDSYLGFETAWGDDAWRWIFRRDGIEERATRCGERAR